MDAIALLKADHKAVKALFREFEKLGDRSQKKHQQVGDQILQELDVHASIEEEIFYPAVQAKAPKDLKDTVLEGIEEHHVVHVLIGELRAMTPADESYVAKFTVLIENVEHHIEEEESEMLPSAAKRLGDELSPLGDQMAARKQQLMAQQPATARP